jgi:putative cell wall-binding protein
MPTRTRFGARRLAAAVIVLLAAALAPPVAAQPSGCPTPVPIEQIRAGMRGTGYTVSKGGTADRFDVEVLGVQQHWFLPSRHIIIVETSSPAIDKAGGIWFGMSGAPVYLNDGRLLGGLAWGFSLGPSKVAGLTPAQEMLDLLQYPVSSQGADEADTAMQGGELSGAVAAQVHQRDPQAGTRMEPLGIPVPVKPRAVDVAQQWFDRAGLPMVAVPASGSGTVTASSTVTPRPGANLAAVLSSGARPFYGSGTLTFVCEGHAVGFAHPFTAAGPMTMGAADGNAIAVVNDPTLGPWKLMTLGASYGKIDQDRFAGIRLALGASAPATPIRSTVTDLDFQRSRTESTNALFARATPFVAAMHLWDAIDDVLDRWGEGTSTLSWTVRGSREDGQPWQLRRDNMFASDWDIGVESFWELWSMLEMLQLNPFETVALDDVAITGDFEQDVKRARLTEVTVSVDGGEPQPAEGGIVAQPGSMLHITAVLAGRGYERPVSLTLQVPDDAFGFAFLTVRGGAFSEFFFDEPGMPGSGELMSFDDLLAQLADKPKGNEVIAEIHTEDWMEAPPEEDWEDVFMGQADGRQARATVERVVEGEAFFELFLDGGFGGVSRVSGPGRVETAVALSQRMFDFGADVVVLSRADTYADALAGGPLAASLGAPLLLTPTAELAGVVAEEIMRLGATHALILGGTNAVSPQVETALRSVGVQHVTRVAGSDRFHTARLIAEQVGGTEVYVAVGVGTDPSRGWPDGLAAGAAGAAQGRPVLLVEQDNLPDATRQAIAALGATRATVVGGSAAVSENVVATLRGLGIEVRRAAGASRYDTAAALAAQVVAEGLNGGRVWLATGRAFADALAAGPAVAADGGVLLLVDGQSLDGSPAVRDWLGQYPAEHVVLVGGTAAINPTVEDEVWELAFGGGDVPPYID